MRFLGLRISLPLGVLVTAFGLGCGSDTSAPVSAGLASQYWQLTLNHHAITMALTPPYDTIRLVATARSPLGVPLADSSATVYAISNATLSAPDDLVTVSPAGLVTAYAPVQLEEIIAKKKIGNVTMADTAYVNVNDVSPVPTFTTFSLQAQPGDSAVVAATQLSSVVPSMLDANNGDIPGVLVQYHSVTDGRFAGGCTFPLFTFLFYNNVCYVQSPLPGKVWVVAEATIYGTMRRDSILFTVTAPLFAVVGIWPKTPAGHLTPVGYFGPTDDTIAVGGIVVWVNEMTGQPADVVFDNPAAAQAADSATFVDPQQRYIIPNQPGGNISPWTAQLDTVGYYGNGTPHTLVIARARQFIRAGTYTYHSALYSGTAGVLHVVPQP